MKDARVVYEEVTIRFPNTEHARVARSNLSQIRQAEKLPSFLGTSRGVQGISLGIYSRGGTDGRSALI